MINWYKFVGLRHKSDGLVWCSYFRNFKKNISTPKTRINSLFAELEPCCQASSFAYNKPQFEDNKCLALRGRQDLLYKCFSRKNGNNWRFQWETITNLSLVNIRKPWWDILQSEFKLSREKISQRKFRVFLYLFVKNGATTITSCCWSERRCAGG